MKLTTFLMVLAFAAAAEQKAPARKPAPKAAPQAKKQGANVIPKDAIEIESYTYRWVDPKGKAWIYRQTPFGIMKSEETPKPDASAAGSAAQASNTIPADAQRIDQVTYRWVDANGKAWIYNRTPFGVVKAEQAQPAAAPEPIPTDWTVVDQGDSIRFERPWPFGGALKWTREKTELTETERAVWQRAQQAKGAAPEKKK